jgi:succinate dehydrogenase / fumarate reductase membrane anchor subunit
MDGNYWLTSNDYYNMVFISFMSNSGRKTWLFQKYSSIALIPLVSYFLVKILQLSSMTYEQIISETSSLWFLVLVLIFAVIGLLHMRLGLHEVIEDYVHSDLVKKLSFIAINLFVAGILGVVSLSVILICIK